MQGEKFGMEERISVDSPVTASSNGQSLLHKSEQVAAS